MLTSERQALRGAAWMSVWLSALRRLCRRWLRRFVPARVAFIYSSQYRLDLPGVPYDPHRAENILTFLVHEGLIKAKNVRWPRRASLRALGQVHSQDYLAAVLQPGGTQRILGYEVPPASEDRFLSVQRAMTGGTLLATRLALATGRQVVNLGGGLHHAHSEYGQGFCAFNDVAVAIAQARASGFAEPILVIDLDLHDGNGTRDIFADDPTVHTFSIHNADWGNAAALGATTIALGSGVEDEVYLEALRHYLPPVVREVRPGLVFYLAGDDPAHDDRLGNWRITADGLLQRDLFVLDTLAAPPSTKPALVVLLAGGYGAGSWRYSARFFAHWLNRGQPLEPPSTDQVTMLRYRHRSELMEEDQLTADRTPDGPPAKGDMWDLDLSVEDLMPGLTERQSRTRLLDFYSTHGVELALERYGLLERLHGLGFEHPTIEIDLDNPAGQTLRIFGDEAKTELLTEARLRRDRRMLPGHEILFVEWLMLQNPRAQFPVGQRPLPGQNHPGLGMLRDVVALFQMICKRLELDGVGFVPAHYHLAAQSHRLLCFVDPEDEARFRALKRDLASLPLAQASRAIDQGQVHDTATGQPLEWQPKPMIIPVSDALKKKVGTVSYEAAVEAQMGKFSFRVEAS